MANKYAPCHPDIDWDQYDSPRTDAEKKRILGIVENDDFLEVCDECGAVLDSNIDITYPATKSGFVDTDEGNRTLCEDCNDLEEATKEMMA